MNQEGQSTLAPPVIPTPPISRRLSQPFTLCPSGTYGLPPPTKPHEHLDKEDRMETDKEKIRPCERGWRGLDRVGRAEGWGRHVPIMGMCTAGSMAEPQGGWHIPGWGPSPMVGVKSPQQVAQHRGTCHMVSGMSLG